MGRTRLAPPRLELAVERGAIEPAMGEEISTPDHIARPASQPARRRYHRPSNPPNDSTTPVWLGGQANPPRPAPAAAAAAPASQPIVSPDYPAARPQAAAAAASPSSADGRTDGRIDPIWRALSASASSASARAAGLASPISVSRRGSPRGKTLFWERIALGKDTDRARDGSLPAVRFIQ